MVPGQSSSTPGPFQIDPALTKIYAKTGVVLLDLHADVLPYTKPVGAVRIPAHRTKCDHFPASDTPQEIQGSRLDGRPPAPEAEDDQILFRHDIPFSVQVDTPPALMQFLDQIIRDQPGVPGNR